VLSKVLWSGAGAADEDHTPSIGQPANGVCTLTNKTLHTLARIPGDKHV
jgi:hypothetical protein